MDFIFGKIRALAVCWMLLLLPFNCIAQLNADTAKVIIKNTLDSAKSMRSGIKRNQTDSIKPAISNDTITASLDTIPAKPKPYQPIPKKAGLYSAILPGLGQVYNHQVWKVPIIYAAITVAGYFFITDLNNYQTFRKAYIGSINNPYRTDQFVGIYTTGQLQQLQNDYEKYLDMTILYSVMGFGMQIIDAISSAHLKNFDISRDISLKMKPLVSPNSFGVGMVMNFK